MSDPAADPPLAALLARWREDAAVLRRRGADARADLLEQLAAEAEKAVEGWWEAELSVKEAARFSGYSRERIRELVRAGKIPDRSPTGAPGAPIRVRRCDLPRHPLGTRDPDAMPVPGDPEKRPADRALERRQGGS